MIVLMTVWALWSIGAAAQSKPQTPQTFPGLTLELEDSITMPVLGQARGCKDAQRVGHREGQRNP